MIRELKSYFYSDLSLIGDLREVESLDDLISVKQEAADKDKKIHIIGAGSNQLILNPEKYIFVKISFPIERYQELKDHFYFSANVHLSQLLKMASQMGLKDWEFITGVPASLGGAIFMNAGTRLGEIKSILKSVQYLDLNNKVVEREVTDEMFSYRKNNFLQPGEIILGATLKYSSIDNEVKNSIKDYLLYRNQSQPLGAKNLGCIFKNTKEGESAGKIIDEAGLKGEISSCKNAQVSDKHGNFINNISQCSSRGYFDFCHSIQELVRKRTGYLLEFEVKFID